MVSHWAPVSSSFLATSNLRVISTVSLFHVSTHLEPSSMCLYWVDFCQLDTTRVTWEEITIYLGASIRLADGCICGVFSWLMGEPSPLWFVPALGRWFPGHLKKQIEQVMESKPSKHCSSLASDSRFLLWVPDLTLLIDRSVKQIALSSKGWLWSVLFQQQSANQGPALSRLLSTSSVHSGFRLSYSFFL